MRAATLAAVVMLGAAPAPAQEAPLPLALTRVGHAPYSDLGFRAASRLRGVRTSELDLLAQLTRRGFENPRVAVDGDTLLLSFEYRMGRGSHAGVCEALSVAGTGFTYAVAVLEHQEVPMASVIFAAPPRTYDRLASTTSIPTGEPVEQGPCAGFRVRSASQDVGPYVSRLQSGRHQPSNLIDVTLHPRYSALFGFYRNPVMLQLNLAPRLNVRLWKGFELGAQVIIPLYNEFSSEGNFVRPGLLTASQFARLPGGFFVRATAGTFTNRRFGLDLRVRRFLQGGRFWVGTDLGRTGNLYYPNGSVFVERDPEWVVLATAGAVWRRHRTYVDGAAGRFLFGDVGARIEVMRQFRGADIGFVFAQTVNGANAGLRIILPLSDGTFVGSRSMRVRVAPDFTWDYMYRAGTDVGESYDSGYYMDRVYRQHHPDYLIELLSSP